MRKTMKSPGDKIVKDIKRAMRKHFSSEEKIRIVLDGLRGEDSIAELCRHEGLSQGIYYKWPKDFMEAGMKRLAGDTAGTGLVLSVDGIEFLFQAILGTFSGKMAQRIFFMRSSLPCR